MPLTLEQFKGLRAKGLSVDQIVKFDAGKVPHSPPPAQDVPNVWDLAKQKVISPVFEAADRIIQPIKDDIRYIGHPPEPVSGDTLSRGPGFLGRMSDLADAGAMKFDATKGLYDFTTREDTPEMAQAKQLIRSVGGVRGNRAEIEQMLAAKGLPSLGKVDVDNAMRFGAGIATPTLGVVGDVFSHVFKTGNAIRDVLSPQLRKNMSVDTLAKRAMLTDRSTGTVAYEQGERNIPKRVEELKAQALKAQGLKAQGLEGDALTDKIAREQYGRKLSGDLLEFAAVPEALSKFGKSGTMRALNRSGKAFKGRFKRPPVMDTEGVASDITKGPMVFKDKGAKQFELFGSKQRARMGAAERTVENVPQQPKFDAGGQQIFPFAKAKTSTKGQAELPLAVAPKQVSKSADKNQQTFRFMRKSTPDGIKSPTIIDKSVPDLPKASIRPHFKTGDEPALLDYLNKSFTGHEVVRMSKSERMRLGNMSPAQLRDEIQAMKNVKLAGPKVDKPAKTVFGKKMQKQAVTGEEVPLHPAQAGKDAEKLRGIDTAEKDVSRVFDKQSKAGNPLKNNRGQLGWSKKDRANLKEWERKLTYYEGQGTEYADQQAAQYRQLIYNLKKSKGAAAAVGSSDKKPRSNVFNKKGQADWGDLTPQQQDELRKNISQSKLAKIFGQGKAESKAAPTIFQGRVRPSKNIGKMARDTQSEHYGRITKRTVKDGQEYFTITGGSLGDAEMVLPRKQLTISQLKPRAGARPSVSPEDATPKFGKVEIFKPKSAAPTADPLAAMKKRHAELRDQIITMSATKQKGRELIKLKALEHEYAKLGREIALTPEQRVAAIKKGRASQGKIERLTGYEDLAKPKRNILSDEAGELRFGPDKNKVRKVKQLALQIVSKAKVAKMKPSDYMAKHTNLTKAQKTELAPYIDEAALMVGNINIARLRKQGSLSPKEAEIMTRAGKTVGKQKVRITRELRASGVNLETFRMAQEIAGMDKASAAAIGEIPFASAQKKIQNYIANPEKGITSMLDDVEASLAEYDALGEFFARGLEARKNPIAVNDMLKALNKARAMASGPDEIRIKGIISDLKGYKAGAFRKAYDIFHELAINNMLSAAITWSRNVSGTAAAGGAMVTDKLASAVVSSVLPEAATAGTKSYLREVPQMIKGIIQSIPHTTKNGMRYFLYEDTRGVVNHLSKKIAKIRAARHKLLAERASKGIKIPQKQLSAELAAYHAKIKTAVRDVKRIYIQESASRLEEVLPTGRRTIRAETFGMRSAKTGELTAPGKVVDAIGYAVNIPSRALIAQDKTFAGAYYGGQSLAAKTRKAIKAKIPLKYVTSEEVAAEKIARLRKIILNTDDPKALANAQQKIKWYKDLKLNKAEEEAVKDAALYYVFREKLPKKMQAWQDVIVDTPVVNTTFPFLKSNYNFIKFTLDHSPLGVYGLKVKGKKGINADQLGKVVAGTAFWSYVYKKIKDSGGEIYGAANTKDERNLLSQTGRKEKRIEWKDGKGDVKQQFEFGNLSPVTQPMLFLAAIDEYRRDKKKGRPVGENLRAHVEEFIKGIASESPYNSLEQTVAAFDNATTTYDAYGTDAKQAGTVSGLKKFGHRWVSGRLVPNLAAEVSKEGKFFGIPIKKPDRAVYDTRSVWEDIRSRMPVDAWKKDLIKRVDWSGKEVKRLPQVSPFNKKFYTGRAVSNDKVFDALFQLEVYPKAPSKTTSGFGFKNIYLTDEERAAMSKKIGPKLYGFLETIVNNPNFKGRRVSDMQRQAILKQAISEFNSLGYAEARVKAIRRMQMTEEGRNALQWGRTKGLSDTPSVFKKRR